MSTPTVIGKHPNDGRDWDVQCARCGSSLAFDLCENCGGEGFIEDDTDQINGIEYEACNECLGASTFPRCLSGAEWCEANPRLDREDVEVSTPEWFVVARR